MQSEIIITGTEIQNLTTYEKKNDNNHDMMWIVNTGLIHSFDKTDFTVVSILI